MSATQDEGVEGQLQRWLRPGGFAMFFDDIVHTAYYARIDGVCVDDADYLECRCYSEGDEEPEVVEVHVSRFVYKLSRAQFIAAWVNGFPSHPARTRGIVNFTKGIMLC